MAATIDPRLLAQLEGLELRARTIVDGWLAGRHRSNQRGFSVEFAEHREYTPGDDLRYLDWKVFGKRDRYQLKQFEAETNFACILLVDVSESMDYRSAGAPWSKRDCATTAAAALASLVLRQNDAAGVALFDSRLRGVVRPSGQGGQWQAILRALQPPTPESGRADATPPHDRSYSPVGAIAERLPARSIAVVFSDGLGDRDSLLTGLRRLCHAKHDVILFHVIDPAEEEFPFEGMTLFRGLEHAGDETADTAPLRKAYRAEFAEFERELSARCRELGGEYVKLRTDQPLDRSLAAFLSRR